MIVSHAPQAIVLCIEKTYRLKDPATDPKTYLGAAIKPWSIPGDNQRIWSMNSQHYLKEAIRNVELELAKSNLTIVGKPSTPMQSDYSPELDISPLLDPDQANYFMSLIGILRWAVELGRIDIYIDVALLSSHMAQPRVGHMEQVIHNFAYLKSHLQSIMVFDPNPIDWDDEQFKRCDWSDFYKDAREPLPPNPCHHVEMKFR